MPNQDSNAVPLQTKLDPFMAWYKQPVKGALIVDFRLMQTALSFEYNGAPPVTSMTLTSWFMVDVPGNMGFPPSSSPSMHPAVYGPQTLRVTKC